MPSPSPALQTHRPTPHPQPSPAFPPDFTSSRCLPARPQPPRSCQTTPAAAPLDDLPLTPQILLLIDFAYMWNEQWLGYDDVRRHPCCI
jgi:hypothetical protein